MKTARQKIDNAAEKLISRGEDMKHVAMTMLHAGLDMVRDGEGEMITSLIVRNGDNQGIEIEWPMEGYKLGIISKMPTPQPASDLVMLIQDAAQMFNGYAELHLAKSPPDIDKARRNVEMAAKLYAGIGQEYNPPEVPENAPESAVEADSAVPARHAPRKIVDTPLDRVELVAWFDMKLDGCTRHGMHETYTSILAMRDEIAQHLERRPIDMPLALRTFYEDVYQRNVTAGWWTDIRTGEPKKRSVGELFILFVTELVEAYDAYCAEDQDDKLPQYPGLGVELGDLQIRFADFAGALQAGNISRYEGIPNPGDVMFREIAEIARRYESIRKSPEAIGQPETGEPFEPMDVAEMIYAKLDYNATRADHKVENRLKEGGKQT